MLRARFLTYKTFQNALDNFQKGKVGFFRVRREEELALKKKKILFTIVLLFIPQK